MPGLRGTMTALEAPDVVDRASSHRLLRRTLGLGFAATGLWLVAGLAHNSSAHAAEPVVPAAVPSVLTHTVGAVTTPQPARPAVGAVTAVVTKAVSVSVHQVAVVVDKELATTAPGTRPVVTPVTDAVAATVIKPVAHVVIAPVVAQVGPAPVAHTGTTPIVRPVTKTAAPVHHTTAPVTAAHRAAPRAVVAVHPASRRDAPLRAVGALPVHAAQTPVAPTRSVAAAIHRPLASHSTVGMHTADPVPAIPSGPCADLGAAPGAGTSTGGGSACALPNAAVTPGAAASGAVEAGHLTAPRERATTLCASPD